jgi:hemolysin-activating ACP:hemolysin acyltransferase
MQDVIQLYSNFKKYRTFTNKELYNHILPSFQCNQYKRFEDDKGLFGFVNWAFLSKEKEDQYIKQGIIKNNEWQSGTNLWLYDIVILRNARIVMSWVYNYFKDYLKVNQCINWLRLDESNNIYRVAKKYKREFHK